MPLEIFDKIQDLVPTNPAGGDDPSFGDDHIRGVKLTLQNQFPNLGASAITKTADEINDLASQTDLTTAEGRITQNEADILLKVDKAGDVMTGQLKGISPVDVDDFTRKDYVDGLTYADDNITFATHIKKVVTDENQGLSPSQTAVIPAGVWHLGGLFFGNDTDLLITVAGVDTVMKNATNVSPFNLQIVSDGVSVKLRNNRADIAETVQATRIMD